MAWPPQNSTLNHALHTFDFAVSKDFVVVFLMKPLDPGNPAQGILVELSQASYVSSSQGPGFTTKQKCWDNSSLVPSDFSLKSDIPIAKEPFD